MFGVDVKKDPFSFKLANHNAASAQFQSDGGARTSVSKLVLRKPNHRILIQTYLNLRHDSPMSKPKSNSSNSSSDEDVKAPNIFERAKEEIEAVIHTGKINPFHKETHGNRDDIDENTPLDVVKAPNVFERVKEEVEALVQTIQQKKDSHTHDDQREHTDKEQSYHDKPENGVKVPKLIEIAKEKIPIFIEKAKEEMGSILHHEKSSNHHKETHGKNDYIDETTPVNEVKAPNVFERAKEELEAIVGTIHPKMGSNDSGSSPKEEKGGFRYCLGMGLEKVCDPWGSKKD